MGLDGVGGTGLAVAAIRARESARPDRLFDDPLAAAFAALRTAGTAPGSEPGTAAGDEPGEPGGRHAAALRAWVVARTVFLDDMLGQACAAGARQVVLLGAGFDARAFRLPWPAGVRCYELDTPDVLGVKAQVLAAQQARPGCERIPVPCDLRADWSAGLAGAGFDPGQAGRLDRRGPARLPGPGRGRRADPGNHPAVRAGQLAGPDVPQPGSRGGRWLARAGPAPLGGPGRPGRVAGGARLVGDAGRRPRGARRARPGPAPPRRAGLAAGLAGQRPPGAGGRGCRDHRFAPGPESSPPNAPCRRTDHASPAAGRG